MNPEVRKVGRWGIASFLNRPIVTTQEELKRVSPDVAIVGVPLDDGQSYKTGARFGPREIRNASMHLSTMRFHLDLDFDYTKYIKVVDYGDTRVVPGYIENSQDLITSKITEVYNAGVIPGVLGGDHSVTYPVVKAFIEDEKEKLGIIQLDAHQDLGRGTLGGRYLTQGTPMRRILETGMVSPRNLVQIGIRDFVSEESWNFAQKEGVHTFKMTDVERDGITNVVKEALRYAWDGVERVYLSIDIDALDPAWAPGTCAPTFGGLTPSDVKKAVRAIAKEGLCGFDLVEVLPKYDIHGLTSSLAARIIVEVLCSLAFRNKIRGSMPLTNRQDS